MIKKQNLFQFESDYTQLALYNITDGLVTPYNFFLGDNTEMAISEFILYPNESSNVEKVNKIVSDTNLVVENKPFLSDNMKKLSVLLNKYIEQL